MAYLFKNHFTLTGNHDEDLSHAPEFKAKIDAVIDTAKTVVSIGWRPDTGYALYEYLHSHAKVVVIEAFESNVKAFERRHLLSSIIHADALQAIESIQDQSIDVLLWQDGPEHVTHEEIDKFLQIAKTKFKHIIFATPNGYFPQGAYMGNVYENHKSTWHAQDYISRGFDVVEYIAHVKDGVQKDRGLIGVWSKEL